MFLSSKNQNRLEPDLREVPILSSLYGILGNVVSEYHTRVGAVHHPHSLLLHSLHITLAFQLTSQTFPVAVITQNIPSEKCSKGTIITSTHISSFFCLFAHLKKKKTQKLIRSMQFLLCSHFPCFSFSSLANKTYSLIFFAPVSPILSDPGCPILCLFGFQLLLGGLHQILQFAESL